MQWGFLFDQTRCTGCQTCIIACKDWHELEGGSENWIKVSYIENGTFPSISVRYLFTACFHCANPLCLKACPVSAIIKRENDGIVIVNRSVCIGGENCRFACQKACPYHIPEFGSEPNAKMQKCDLCLDRLLKGQNPVCVGACPMRALEVSPIEKLREIDGNNRSAAGFVYSDRAGPSVVFKTKVRKGNL